MYVCDFEQLLSLCVLNFSSVNGCGYQFWDVWLFWELQIHSFVSLEDFNIYLLIWPSCLAPADSVLPLSFCCVSLLLWNRNKIHAHSNCCLSFISISPYPYYQQVLLPELQASTKTLRFSTFSSPLCVRDLEAFCLRTESSPHTILLCYIRDTEVLYESQN